MKQHLVCMILLCFTTIGFSAPSSAQIKVFACEPEWHALAEEIGGDHLSSFSATTAQQDPHHIEARPSLIAKARSADLIFCTGAELEVGWLPLLLRQSGNSRIQADQQGYFMAADQVEKIEVPVTIDRSMGDIHASGNPHIHLDPYRLLIIAEAFTQRLLALDPAHQQYYLESFEQFKQDWQRALEKWQRMASPLKGKKVVIQHSNLNYMLDWLDLQVVSNIEPKPGIPPSSRHLASLLTTLKNDKPDLIVVAAYQHDKGARWLAGRLDVPVVKLPYTVGGDDSVNSLSLLFERSIQLLLEGLNHGG